MLGPHPGKNSYTQENECEERLGELIKVIITKGTDDNTNTLSTKSSQVTVEAVGGSQWYMSLIHYGTSSRINPNKTNAE